MSSRMLRLKLLLSLSLVYGCSTPGGAFSPIDQILSGSNFRLLNAGEIEQVKASGLVEANNRFGWKLFDRIVTESPGQNHFISPISATFALQMVLQGANNDTLSEMKQALELDKIDNPTLLKNVSLLLNKLHRPAQDIRIEVANSIWASRDYSFFGDFLSAVNGPFNAKVSLVDFAAADTATRINQWANQSTQGKIPKLIDKIEDPRTVAYLINAIYFKGDWTEPFEKAETQPKPFYLENGTTKSVPMMRKFDQFLYHSPNDAFPHQGVALPYGKEGKLKMYVFLPTIGKTLADLRQDLSKQDFKALHNRFYLEGGSVQLPRFKMDWKRRLNDDLVALGMKKAFSPSGADFSKMVDLKSVGDNVYLSYVDQFTHVDVNEEGTVAAAVTVAVAVPASSVPTRTLDMLVDHPFVFLIRDEETEQILFMGSINDPT